MRFSKSIGKNAATVRTLLRADAINIEGKIIGIYCGSSLKEIAEILLVWVGEGKVEMQNGKSVFVAL